MFHENSQTRFGAAAPNERAPVTGRKAPAALGLALSFALFTTIPALGFSGTPPPDRTGAPGQGGGTTCAACHTTSGSGGVSLGFSGAGSEYMPGETYTIEVQISDFDPNGRRGFSMVARAVNNDTATAGAVGEWILSSDDLQEVGTAPDLQIGHKTAPPATGAVHTFAVEWKAPAALVGDVKFYVAAVAGGSESGASADDRTYTDQNLTLREVMPPQTRVVSDISDVSLGSLRQTIADAAPGDTITFAADLENKSITLGGSQILIDKNLTIDASALPGGITLSGGQVSRVFEVAAGVEVTMDSLTITKGNTPDGASGGGILNAGTLTLQRSTLTDNTSGTFGGAIENTSTGVLHVTDSTLSDNTSASDGGGICNNNGSLSIIDSTVSGNRSSAAGGGIWSSNSAFLSNCRITGNSTTSGSGGGVLTQAGSLFITDTTVFGNTTELFGGGIYNSGSSLTITNSTISGNTSNRGGGIYSQNLTAVSAITTTLSHCTVVDNQSLDGGGIRNWAGVTVLDHCTLTRNTAPVGSGGGIATQGDSIAETRLSHTVVSGNIGTDLDRSPGLGSSSFTSNNFNLIGTGNAADAFSGSGDITGVSSPSLGPLCNNGGPTKTVRPLPGSPAINAGGSTGLQEDQRGFPRLVGTTIDIGAVESERVSFDLEWSGASFGNGATATGRITVTPSDLMDDGESSLGPLTDLTISVAGASQGSGTYHRSDFEGIFLSSGDGSGPSSTPLDFSLELIGQTTHSGSWGDLENEPSNGFFDLHRSPGSPTAPASTSSFVLRTAGGESMRLTSFRPANQGPPAGSLVHPADLTTAFTTRKFLTDSPGEISPAPVSETFDGSTTIWQWTPQVDGWFDISTFGSSFDTRLTVYEGIAADALTYVAGNDDAFPGEFAGDHPQPDRSALILPLQAGKTYQFVLGGGVNGESGGSLVWLIQPVEEPLPPAVEIRTFFPFDFLPAEYAGGTALIDTIVPVGGFGKKEPYIYVLDTRSGVWNTVEEVEGQVVGSGDVTVRPSLGAGSALRISDASLLSSEQRFSPAIADRFFKNPTSQFPGPFVTVASARYPHRFGSGHKSICVDLRAEGGQGYGLTHMPKEHLEDPSQIAPTKGGLLIDFQFVGNRPSNASYGYSLKNADGSSNSGLLTGANAEILRTDLEPGLYSISFNPVDGYRIAVARKGEGVPDPDRANINLEIPNVIEDGSNLVNISRDLCIFFPNSVDCSHFQNPEFEPPNFLAASGCDVIEGMVTTISVQYIELATGKDVVGYHNVADPAQVLDDNDVLGKVGNPFVESAFLNLSNEKQTMVLAMRPDEEAAAGRVIRWKKPSGGPYPAGWVEWRNFVSLGRNFDRNPDTGASFCFDCHTHDFDDPRDTIDPMDGELKIGGGEPRVPWFKPIGGDRDTVDIAVRLEPQDPEPFTLAILNRPFDNGLNFRMPIDIEANEGASPPRRTWVEYANQRWEIQQAAGPGYLPNVTITGGNQINLTPGSTQHTVSFSAGPFWFAEVTENSSWIHIAGSPDGTADGMGPGSFRLSFDPNPGARPRVGTVQIGDMFFNVVQPIEPPEVLSLEPLSNPAGYRFTLNPMNGVRYNLEFSNSLAPGSWTMKEQKIGERDAPPVIFETTDPDQPSRGFYRIRSEPTQ